MSENSDLARAGISAMLDAATPKSRCGHVYAIMREHGAFYGEPLKQLLDLHDAGQCDRHFCDGPAAASEAPDHG